MSVRGQGEDLYASSSRAVFAIGVDVGGTFCRAALVNQDGDVLNRTSVTTQIDCGVDGLIASLSELIESACNVPFLHGATKGWLPVGLAIPGLIDGRAAILDGAVVTRCVNLPFLEGISLHEELAERVGLKVYLLSDITAATWAEKRVADAERFVHLRIGTGVGCGVYVGGELQELARSGGGHPDILVCDESSRAVTCPCGLRGCLEMYVGGGRFDTSDSGEVFLAAQRIGAVISRIDASFSPERIALGGGVIEHTPELFLAIRKSRQANERPGEAIVSIVDKARLANDAGVIGAAMLAAYQNRQSPAL